MLKIIIQEAHFLTIILIYLGRLFNNLKRIIVVQIEVLPEESNWK